MTYEFEPSRHMEVRMDHLEIGDIMLTADGREAMVIRINRVFDTYYVKVAVGGRRDAVVTPSLVSLEPLDATFIPIIRRTDVDTKDRNGRSI